MKSSRDTFKNTKSNNFIPLFKRDYMFLMTTLGKSKNMIVYKRDNGLENEGKKSDFFLMTHKSSIMHFH